MTLLLETVYSVQKILLHTAILQNPIRPKHTHKFLLHCVTKHGILDPEANIIQFWVTSFPRPPTGVLTLDPAGDSCPLNPLPRRMSFVSNDKLVKKQVRQQDAYLAIRPAYPRGCCPRAAKGDKTYLQPVFLHR